MTNTEAANIMIKTLSRAADEVRAMTQGPDADRWVMRYPSGLYVCNAQSNSGLRAALKWDSIVDARTQAGDMRDGNGQRPTPCTVRHAIELEIQDMRRTIDSILHNINASIRAYD